MDHDQLIESVKAELGCELPTLVKTTVFAETTNRLDAGLSETMRLIDSVKEQFTGCDTSIQSILDRVESLEKHSERVDEFIDT